MAGGILTRDDPALWRGSRTWGFIAMVACLFRPLVMLTVFFGHIGGRR